MFDLNNSGLKGVDDIRDLWNQQTPFAIDEKLRPVFLQRLKDSLANYDMRDGKQDWTPSALAANANMFVDDFLLFDVAKPITDASHLEIEKSTLNGKAYQTGGGRTVDAECHRRTVDVDRESRSRIAGRRDDEGNKAGNQEFPIPCRTESGPADGGGDGRCQRNARQGMGADRPVWRRLLASPDRGRFA